MTGAEIEVVVVFFFFKQKTAYEIGVRLVGSEMCIRDSLGISPAPALMHGFYTVDGYSNNYPLEYKHRFREVIAPEIEKNEEVRVYFDTWGNRCYLFNPVSYTHLRAHETDSYLVCRLLLEKKKKKR